MHKKNIAIYFLIFLIFIVFFSGCTIHITTIPPIVTPTPTIQSFTPTVASYPLHKNITVTIFWIGEGATNENAFISNVQSAWDEKWLEHYGGVDDPYNRIGYFPEGFIPRENPFYFALPYNDFDENGRKESAYKRVYWAGEKIWASDESMCKNRWIRIIKQGKVAYAQWEDVGPFETDDVDYVFGEAPPKNHFNNNAGLDVSPAVKDYLGLSGMDKVDWQFVNSEDVPDGPWKEIVTTSGTCWGEDCK